MGFAGFVMHEMSIVSSLVEQIRAHVPPGSVVERVLLEVGALEHLVDEMLQAAWVGCTLETELADAELVVERVAMWVRCGNCETEFEPVALACLYCPECGLASPIILRGKGVVLKSIEVQAGERVKG